MVLAAEDKMKLECVGWRRTGTAVLERVAEKASDEKAREQTREEGGRGSCAEGNEGTHLRSPDCEQCPSVAAGGRSTGWE